MFHAWWLNNLTRNDLIYLPLKSLFLFQILLICCNSSWLHIKALPYWYYPFFSFTCKKHNPNLTGWYLCNWVCENDISIPSIHHYMTDHTYYLVTNGSIDTSINWWVFHFELTTEPPQIPWKRTLWRCWCWIQLFISKASCEMQELSS